MKVVVLRMKTESAAYKNILIYATLATFGGFLFGYNTGVMNGAIDLIRLPQEFNLSPVSEGLVTSSLTFSAAFGALISGNLSDYYGRRKVLFSLSLLFFIGSVLCSIAINTVFMVMSRLILGLAVGGASVIVPTYLAEISTPTNRGKIVTRNELMLVIGQFTAFLINAILGIIFHDYTGIWRFMLGISIIPAIVLLIGTFIIPESPRWLYMNNFSERSLKSLNKIRLHEEAKREMEKIDISLKRERQLPKARLSDFKIPHVRKILLVGIGIGISAQLIGINIMMYYGTTILKNSGFSSNAALIANIANGIISVVSVAIGIKLMNKVKRRNLILTGILGTTICLFLIYLSQLFLTSFSFLPFITLSLTVLFIGFFQAGVAPITWLLLSEIFPQKIRGLGMGIATFFLWMANCFVALIFPILLSLFELANTFLIFTIFNVLCFLFTFKYVPETKDKTLEEIELDFKFNKI
jgi:major inositol transporter-like SP family MFS transporter